MKTHIYLTPAPPGTEVVAASPVEVLRTLQRLFPCRLSSVGIQLNEGDLGALEALTRPATGDVNLEAWCWIVSEIRRHSAVHVWNGAEYKEEA